MCIADTLPNLENWKKLYLKEFETKEKITIFIYTKNTTTYKIEKINNDSVKIIKRIIK
jgi:glutaredoxin 2